MNHDDPRHGTTAGHHAGCRDDCCREPRNRYERNGRKRRELGYRSLVDPTGTQRRIQALMAIGWTQEQIAQKSALVRQRRIDSLLREVRMIRATTARQIADAYDELSMTPGPSSITRARALARGWAPPLGWDDIDRDPAPTGVWRGTTRNHQGPSHDTIDEARILRILGGDYTLAKEATNAERHQIVARWDGTLAELERRTGWKVDRYLTREDGAA